jgi:hypothetical protein
MDYQPSGTVGLIMILFRMPATTSRVLIENEGFEAVPVFPNPPEVYCREFR